MQNVQIPPDQMQDPKGKWSPEHSRDYERTPMQWNANVNAGFAAPHVKPWLPVADDFQTCNVEAEQHDPRSIPMLVHALLERRRTSPALSIGSYQSIDQENDACFVYLRQHNEQRYLVALNVSAQDQVVKLPGLGHGSIVLSTQMDREGPLDLSEIHLRGNEGCLIELA